MKVFRKTWVGEKHMCCFSWPKWSIWYCWPQNIATQFDVQQTNFSLAASIWGICLLSAFILQRRL